MVRRLRLSQKVSASSSSSMPSKPTHIGPQSRTLCSRGSDDREVDRPRDEQQRRGGRDPDPQPPVAAQRLGVLDDVLERTSETRDEPATLFRLQPRDVLVGEHAPILTHPQPASGSRFRSASRASDRWA